MIISLWDHQEIGVTDIRKAFKDKLDPVLFQMATGGGKTRIFCYIAANAADKGNSIVIIVHRTELLSQASKTLHSLGIPHGLISPHYTPDPFQKIQVASVDTLLIRLKKNPAKYKFDLLVFDETHHVTQKNKWGRVFEMLGKPRTLGVTATPARGDGIGMGTPWGGIFNSIVVGPPISKLIEQGTLVNPVVYAGKIIPNFASLKPNKEGEYDADQMAALVDKKAITGNAVEHYTAICPGVRTIVFCANIAHCQHVAEQFCEAGYKFKVLVGAPHMKDAEREKVVRDIMSGEIQGICACDLVNEGFDVPGLICAIMLRHVGSISLFLQQVGRVMRAAPGKTIAFLLDHVGNVGVTLDGQFLPKHGLPSQDREWTLEGRKKGKKKSAVDPDEIKLVQCKGCYYVFQPGKADCPTCATERHATSTAPPCPHCPSCGLLVPVKETRKAAQEVDGKLVEITDDMVRIQQIQRRREVAQARTMDELTAYAAKMGYSKGWAWHTFNSRKNKAA